jgi:hypothetical protein
LERQCAKQNAKRLAQATSNQRLAALEDKNWLFKANLPTSRKHVFFNFSLSTKRVKKMSLPIKILIISINNDIFSTLFIIKDKF